MKKNRKNFQRPERDVDGLQASLKQANEKNKPVQQVDQNGNGPNGLPLVGAAIGAAVAGPVGGFVGGILGSLNIRKIIKM